MEIELATARAKADAKAAARIVERVVSAQRADQADFAKVITLGTSGDFDSWAYDQLEAVTGLSDKRALDEILMDAPTLTAMYGDDDDEDGDEADGDDHDSLAE